MEYALIGLLAFINLLTLFYVRKEFSKDYESFEKGFREGYKAGKKVIEVREVPYRKEIMGKDGAYGVDAVAIEVPTRKELKEVK